MIHKRQLIYSVYVILVLCILAYASQWNGIAPLESTRTDVERILGKPEPGSKSKSSNYFKMKNERVFVLYSSGDCNVRPSSGWNIPKGKVIRISVNLFVPLKFADYKFDKSKFRNYIEPDISFFTTYTNEVDGIGFTVDTDKEAVLDFYYFPESKYDYLKCSDDISK